MTEFYMPEKLKERRKTKHIKNVQDMKKAHIKNQEIKFQCLR